MRALLGTPDPQVVKVAGGAGMVNTTRPKARGPAPPAANCAQPQPFGAGVGVKASSSITYFPLEGWRPLTPALNFSSVSSFAKNAIICHFKDTHEIHTCTTESSIDKHADNGRLGTIMTQSPDMPVGGCTTTMSSCASGVRSYYRLIVLTNASHPFVAWISFTLYWNVGVVIETSEPAVCGVGRAFKDRFPQTTRLARVVLGAVISAMVFDR
ncbi:unnamed protein product [Vitrella brassicaformis CCMP3155]|uniref:Uncharacterized protein n=1 Tax=Vitrella brassicaformis (strain CCMP3155) TaxID=1169540 RepID=A0A0G4EUL9_VITBC|nr:unnamed protein product [Vitrella brassicaformis CCMP3155]|eukprot:CEM02134.1 unnamed protein product [Vitrella brassicaformis CCMP3155]